LASFRRAKDIENIELVGIHAHRGIKIREASEIRSHVKEILDFTRQLKTELGFSPRILNFGGSLSSPTVKSISELDRRMSVTFLAEVSPPDPDDCLSITDYTSLVLEMVYRHCENSGTDAPVVFFEPGRAMTSNTQLLLCSVMNTKESPDDFTYAVLDGGINIAEAASTEYHQIFLANKFNLQNKITYRLVGPICTPGDILYYAKKLPRLESGDTLAIMDSGAYFVPFETSFSFVRPKIIMLQDGKVELVREAEDFSGMVQRDVTFQS
jgi:diaminopimelate decarboxylase